MTSGRICDAGDSALLLQLDDVIDVAVNTRVIGIANAVRRDAIAGVRDVVSTYRSVAVHFDPLRTDVTEVRSALERGQTCLVSPVSGKTIDVPVAYGAEYGPDLDDVAAFADLSSREVIECHTAAEYRVFMLGFLPGFAYLGKVEARIAAPRRSSPRLRVPMGSVGIAGQQTGIYPRQSPGGWQIIGRTALEMFDADRASPTLLAPGDSVRFVSVDAGIDFMPRLAVREHPHNVGEQPTQRHVTVLRPGFFSTVQDLGRWGHQSEGVSVSGAMDLVAHRVANALVGNHQEAATLEVTIVGPELRLEHAAVVAVTGADLGATIDGTVLPRRAPVACRPGSVLQFMGRKAGARAYIAFDGGFAVPRACGGRATHVLSSLGGVDGRALRAGDRLPLGPAVALQPVHFVALPESVSEGGARVRVLPGPQHDWFPDAALDTLQRTRFTVGTNSDRMGYRLTSPMPIRRRVDREMITDATFAGGVQVPPSGEPIVLMADRQTTGGYPQIATVITADLPTVGQLAPGDWIEFEVCSRAEALAALRAQEDELSAIE